MTTRYAPGTRYMADAFGAHSHISSNSHYLATRQMTPTLAIAYRNSFGAVSFDWFADDAAVAAELARRDASPLAKYNVAGDTVVVPVTSRPETPEEA